MPAQQIQDLRQGKQTALAASSVEHAMASARLKVQDALGVMDGLGLANARITALCHFLVERDH